MPLRLEEIDGCQMWQLICDQCAVRGDHLASVNAAHEAPFWHMSEEESDSELEYVAVLCDVCFHLRRDERALHLHFETRDAIVDLLRELPGGHELDFGQGTRLRAVIDALATGGPQEDLEDRLVNVGGFALDPDSIPTQRSTQSLTTMVEQRDDTTTAVFHNPEACDLPEWVHKGVWVRRTSDQTEGFVVVVTDTNVLLSFEDQHTYWRRSKTVRFGEEFEPLPEPPNRYERLMGGSDPIYVVEES